MRRTRGLAFLLLAALALPALYLAGANLFLGTGLAPSLVNRNPEKLLLEWSRAWSLAPGRVSLREVRIRGQTRSLLWIAELDRVDVSLRLPPLFRRHFHATSIRGSGLELRLRRPGSEGFDARHAPTVRGPGEEEGWRLELDSIDIGELRLLWIDEVRLDCEGGIAGRLDYRIHGSLAVDDARVELRDARLRAGEEVAARSLDAVVSASLGPVVPDSLEGLEILDHLSGEVDLEADEASIEAINRYLEKVPWLTLAGFGRLTSRARFSDGKIEPGSELSFESSRLSAFFFDYQARGRGQVRASVDDAQPPQTGIEIRLADFEVRRDGYEQPHVRGEGFEIDVAADGLDLSGRSEAVGVEVRLPRSEVPDLSFYSAYLPQGSGAAIRSGRGTIGGWLRVSTSTDDGEGELRLRGTGVALQLQNLMLDGDLELTTRFTDVGIAARRLALDGSRLEIADVELSEGGDVEEKRWRGSFELTRGTLSFDEPRLDAAVEARLRDSRPVVAVIAEKAWLLEWFEGLLTVEDIVLETDIRVDRHALAFERLELQGDELEILARLRFARHERRGIVYARWRAFSVGLELGPEGRDWKLRHPRRWFVSNAGFGARDESAVSEELNGRTE